MWWYWPPRIGEKLIHTKWDKATALVHPNHDNFVVDFFDDTAVITCHVSQCVRRCFHAVTCLHRPPRRIVSSGPGLIPASSLMRGTMDARWSLQSAFPSTPPLELDRVVLEL